MPLTIPIIPAMRYCMGLRNLEEKRSTSHLDAVLCLPMAPVLNPALTSFISGITDGLTFAQVIIRPAQSGFELRHVDDRGRSGANLRQLNLSELRDLVSTTARGAYRPLKSAPNLQAGWRLAVNSPADLERALNQIYPGAIADWYAARSPAPPVTHFREFTARQTGMYRISSKLLDSQAAVVVRACCHSTLCLKRRLWTVEGLPHDPEQSKSVIPCLEPCAVFLEFSRKSMRFEQEEKQQIALAPSELRTLIASLEQQLENGAEPQRAADLDDDTNPRRIRLVLEKLASFCPETSPHDNAGEHQ
jgi:hypothetical protein